MAPVKASAVREAVGSLRSELYDLVHAAEVLTLLIARATS